MSSRITPQPDRRPSARRASVLWPLAALLLLSAVPLGCASGSATNDAAPEQAGAAGDAPQTSRRRRVMLYTKREQLDTPLPTGASLLVRASGPVSVVEGDLETMLVRARLSAASETRMEGASIRAEVDAQGRLVVDADWPGGKQRDEVASFEVRLPRGSGTVEVEAIGAVTLSGLGRDAVVRTTDGSVTVTEHKAGVHAFTSNAQMSFERVAGVIRAETTNGIVLVREARGPVSVKTSKAAIDIRLAADASGPVRAITDLGAVALRVGRGFAGTLTMRTANAPIVVDMPSGAGEIVSRRIDETVVRFGEGSESTVETNGGTIELRVLSR